MMHLHRGANDVHRSLRSVVFIICMIRTDKYILALTGNGDPPRKCVVSR